MIDLAPQHKIGLPLNNPVMIAAGFGGYGDAYKNVIELAAFGAVVTQPITLRPRRGAPQPRVVEIERGLIFNTGLQNAGVKKVLQRYRKIWSRLDVPVIAHLPADEPDDLMRTARALSGATTPQGDPLLAAFELGVPHAAHPQDVEDWLRAVQDGSELPILAKLPITAPPDIAAAAAAYTDALVVGLPPLAAAFDPATQQFINGLLFGPALHSLTLFQLQKLTELHLPLIAVGGLHTTTDAQQSFDAGANAVQIDSLMFVDPKRAESIALNYSP